MTFTQLEMSAVVKMGKMMIAADGEVDPKEVMVQVLEFRRFGIQKESIETIVKLADEIDFSTAIGLISKFDRERKKYVVSYLATIMAADGDIDDKELALWQAVSTLCDFPTMSIAEGLKYMTEL